MTIDVDSLTMPNPLHPHFNRYVESDPNDAESDLHFALGVAQVQTLMDVESDLDFSIRCRTNPSACFKIGLSIMTQGLNPNPTDPNCSLCTLVDGLCIRH